MILILAIYFVAVALLFMVIYKSNEVKSIGLLMATLSIMMVTVLVYMAKKGGINNELLVLFFINRNIRNALQYLNISLSQLGFTMALGRTLFPFLLFKIGMDYSMWPIARKYRYLSKYVLWIPIVILVFYVPPIFHGLIHYNVVLTEVLLWLSNALLVIFSLFGLSLFIVELFSIDLVIYRKQFGQLTLFMGSLTVLFLLYLLQEPTQVYRFYEANFFWQQGLFYLYSVPMRMYLLLLLLTVISSGISIFSLTKYTHNIFVNNQAEMKLKQRKQTISPVITMFIHGIKNQFLTHQIIHRRLEQELSQPEFDREKCLAYIKQLQGDTEDILFRINRVYRSLKENRAVLQPLQASDVVYGAIQRALEQYTDCHVSVNLSVNPVVLVDYELMCEAMSNLLVNAHESIKEKGNLNESSISITVRSVRAFTLFEFKDNGMGMTEKEIRKVFTPFYSSKNSKMNWGLGLYFVREIVKAHFGGIYLESHYQKGSKFTIYLPKYKANAEGQE
ncbi:MAG: ATP-binding protein [Aerococcaceae bacterium]|nr:ATP-binding protein [Aerococcaceae bacterium]